MRKATLTLSMALVAGAILGFAPQAKASEAEVKEMINLVNQERSAKGLRPLAESPALDQVSRAHSQDMVKSGFFSHESPNTGSPTDRLRAGGVRFQVAGENIAMDLTISEAHKHLMQSPGHRRNILLPDVNHIGIGVVHSGRHIYVTQTFAKLTGQAPLVAQAPIPAPAQLPIPTAPVPAAPPPVAQIPAAPAPVAQAPAPQAAPPLVQPGIQGPAGLRRAIRESEQPQAEVDQPQAPGQLQGGMRPRGHRRLKVVMTPYGRMCVLNRMTVAPCGYVKRVMAKRAMRAAMRAQRMGGEYGGPPPGYGMRRGRFIEGAEGTGPEGQAPQQQGGGYQPPAAPEGYQGGTEGAEGSPYGG